MAGSDLGKVITTLNNVQLEPGEKVYTDGGI